MTKRSPNPHAPSLHLANRVREFRLALGLTQAQLAERAGVSLRVIADCERAADTYNPTYASMCRIARALDRATGEIFYESCTPATKPVLWQRRVKPRESA